jgi:hypothetical protein
MLVCVAASGLIFDEAIQAIEGFDPAMSMMFGMLENVSIFREQACPGIAHKGTLQIGLIA